MASVRRYMRPGAHRGVAHGVEVEELATGMAVVEAIYVGERLRKETHSVLGREFATVEAAFDAGIEAARALVDSRYES